jgi:hypothetical protein
MAAEQDASHSSDHGEPPEPSGADAAFTTRERVALRIADGPPAERCRSLRRPTFLIIGAMKASTTSLFDRLATHPEIGIASIKEPDFFIAEKNLRKGLGWYESLFAGTEGNTARGEASTSYSKCGQFPGVPRRIHAVVPDVRLIYLLRDPVDRIRSMYQHNVLTGRERRPADEAVTQDPKYLDASRYGLQVQQYLSVFPSEQLLVLTMDDLHERPEPTLRTVCAHIGVDWHPPLLTENPRSNVTAERRGETVASRALRAVRLRPLLRHVPPGPAEFGKRILTRKRTVPSDIAPETLAELRDRLRPDIELLETLVDRSFENWRHPSA